MGIVVKGWGREVIFANEDEYCGKLLEFNQGGKFSMHFHRDKKETWYVLEGQICLKTINTKTSKAGSRLLNAGDVWTNFPCEPHQVECLSNGCTIIEVSTQDSIEDNYRIAPGDSQ